MCIILANTLENCLKKLFHLLPTSLGRQVLARFPCSNPTLAEPPNNYNLTDKITIFVSKNSLGCLCITLLKMFYALFIKMNANAPP